LLQQSFRFRDASFFVSPARHGEAQDMSGTWNKRNRTKQKTQWEPQQEETVLKQCTHKLTSADGTLGVSVT
jgi:hypothetical protein